VVFYSIKSNEKVFHLPHCNVTKRIRKEYKRQFITPEEARFAGYRMCNCCSPLGVRLRKEQTEVDQICQKNGITYRLEDGQLHIYNHKGAWRIIASGKGNKPFLYHKNTHDKPEKIPSIVPGYHYQYTRSNTIAGYLEYIAQHDAYWIRQKEKKKENAQKKAESMRNLRRNTRPYLRGKDNRSFNANQLYSIMDSINL